MSSRVCDRCRHLVTDAFGAEFCESVPSAAVPFTPIDRAREICDREWDGRFVYVAPLDEIEPSTGATFVQITREKASAATAGA